MPCSFDVVGGLPNNFDASEKKKQASRRNEWMSVDK